MTILKFNKQAKTICFVVNVDYFFISHRLPLAIEAIGRGYNIIVFARNTGFLRDLERFGINVHDLPLGRGRGNGINDIFSLMKLSYFYFRYKPNIVHHITAKAVIYGTIAAGVFNRRCKVVNSVTGLGYVFMQKDPSFTKSITLCLLKIAAFLGTQNALFVFQNKDDQKLYIDSGIAKPRLSHIIPGAGVDESYYSLEPNSRIEDGMVVVTFLARMLKDKGVLEFVESAISLKEQLFGKVFFRLVGGVDLDNPAALTENEVLSFVVQDYLVWEGHRTDVKEVYKNTHIACLLSYREGMPKSLIEAMAMSCAIITTDAPGCRECVDEGINGYLVPVRDSELLAQRILELVNDRDKRECMGRASRDKMVKTMSLSRVIEQTFALYES